MTAEKQNVCIPGSGFLFSPDGLSLAEMATKLHKLGYLSDEEMAQDGGVTALRRKVYDELRQSRPHYSKHRKRFSEVTEEERKEQAQANKLMREMNDCADALGVNDRKYMDMIIAAEDLEAFGIQINGKNMVTAELVAKSIHNDPFALDKMKASPSQTVGRISEMVRWVLAGRPDDRRG